MRQREMLFSGNKPCTATPTDTGPCECETRLIINHNLFNTCNLLCQLQMKGPGQIGKVGGPALEHVIQTEDNAQCSTVVINHARQPQLIQDPANVRQD